jgi:hypothetical protein
MEDWRGGRVLSEAPLGEAVFQMASTLANWCLPWSASTFPKLLILAAVGGVIALALSRGFSQRTEKELSQDSGTAAFGWFVFFYGVGLLVLSQVLAFDRLADRLLAPAYAPLAIWLITATWNRVSAFPLGRRRRMAAAIPLLLFAVWAGRSAVATGLMVEHEHRVKAGLTGDRWRDSKVIAHLREDPTDAVLYSNIAHAVYLYSSLTARESPRRHFFETPNRPTGDLARFREVVERVGEVHLVWFEVDTGTYLLELDDLRQHFELELLDTLADGAIYRVTAKRSDPN